MSDSLKIAINLARIYNEEIAEKEILRTDVVALYKSVAPYSASIIKEGVSYAPDGDYFVVSKGDTLSYSKVNKNGFKNIERKGEHLYIPLNDMKEFVKTLLRQLIQKSKSLESYNKSLEHLEKAVKSLVLVTDPILDKTLRDFDSLSKEDKETVLYQTKERLNSDVREAIIGSWLLNCPRPFICPGMV